MTNEEAIKCIEDVLDSDYHYDESLGYQLTSDDFGWLEKAKEALEKQIPKKPERIEGTLFGKERYYHKCPNCGDPYVDDSYCPICGQAIDWSDEE